MTPLLRLAKPLRRNRRAPARPQATDYCYDSSGDGARS
uniref:Uncharacterized protein n=1 Tax=Arundo donax TaxID=35708 RepID=A0A0A9HPG9_ARUDO